MPGFSGKLCTFPLTATIIPNLCAKSLMEAHDNQRVSRRDAFPMYFLYRVVTAVGMFVLAPYFALRGWRRGERRGAFRERLGILSRAMVRAANSGATPEAGARRPAGPIWIHAVSVGEVLAAKPLVEGLKREFPGRAIFVSTTTETGSGWRASGWNPPTAYFIFLSTGLCQCERRCGRFVRRSSS